MPTPARTATALARACHPGPSLAVTGLTAVFGIGAGLGAGRLVLLLVAVGAGQLVIGWSNDLLDAGRDRLVGRLDKPLATGELSGQVARRALGAAAVLTVSASLACGLGAGLTHLLLVVGGGVAYDLGLKRTVASFVPYVVAFGALPAVVTLSLPAPSLPAPWVMAAAGLLGVGAHLLNVLPDLADDAATGVQGLPHRLGHRGLRVAAPVVLLAATALLLVGPPGPPAVLAWLGAAVVVVLLLGTARMPGRLPFYGAIAVAVVDVLLLVTSW